MLESAIKPALMRSITCALPVAKDKVQDTATLRRLGADSMTLLELTLDVEQRFRIELPPNGKITMDTTVEELYSMVLTAIADKERTRQAPQPVTMEQFMTHSTLSARFHVPYHSSAMAQHAEVGKALASYKGTDVLSVVYGVRHEEGVARCHVHITYMERERK